jgi:NAD(P)H-quinone oxidoreductase subunit 5
LLFLAQIVLLSQPQGRFAQACYPWAYNGFYLDETFTRVTFRIWPARLTSAQAQTRVHRHSDSLGDLV